MHICSNLRKLRVPPCSTKHVSTTSASDETAHDRITTQENNAKTPASVAENRDGLDSHKAKPEIGKGQNSSSDSASTRHRKRQAQKNVNATSASVPGSDGADKAAAVSDSDDDKPNDDKPQRRRKRPERKSEKPKPSHNSGATSRAERRRKRRSKRQSRRQAHKNAHATSASIFGRNGADEAASSSDSDDDGKPNDDKPQRQRKLLVIRKTEKPKPTQDSGAKNWAEQRKARGSKRQAQNNANATSASVPGSDGADKAASSSDSNDDDKANDDKPQTQSKLLVIRETDASGDGGVDDPSPLKAVAGTGWVTPPNNSPAHPIATKSLVGRPADSPENSSVTQLGHSDVVTRSTDSSGNMSTKAKAPDSSQTHAKGGDRLGVSQFDQTMDAALLETTDLSETANLELDNVEVIEVDEDIELSKLGNITVDSKQLSGIAVKEDKNDDQKHTHVPTAFGYDQAISSRSILGLPVNVDESKKEIKNKPTIPTKYKPAKTISKHYLIPLNSDGGLDCTLDDLEKGLIIGQGAFGSVFIAKIRYSGDSAAAREDEIFALKKMSKNQIIKESNPEAVLRETEVLRLVRGSIFCPYLFAAMQDDNYLYLLQEFLQGGDLYFLMKNSGMFDYSMLPVYIARTYCACLVCALTFLHEQGVVFRDLKPENIMLTANGHIKLVDFGIAKQIGSNRTFTIMGTPEYIAPEALLGSGYGFSVDVWGLVSNACWSQSSHHSRLLRVCTASNA